MDKTEVVALGELLIDFTDSGKSAGDTFCGCIINTVLKYIKAGMVLADLPEAELCDMLTFANAAASIITTRKGALMVMPKKEEIDSFIMTTDCAL